MLLWDVLTHDELRKKYFEKMEEVKLDPSGFEKALEMLVKRKLIIKGVGYTGADALYNMLYDTYVIPLRGVQGTRRLLNIAKLLKWYQDNDVKVCHIHSYGTYQGYKDYPEKLKAMGIDINNSRRIIKDYINMPVAMAAADLVISRCGAASLAELEAMGRASVLIPSPMVAENHQYYNGMVLQNAGAGFVIEEKDLTEKLFIDTVKGLIEDPEKLRQCSENAAKLHVADTEDRIFKALEPLIKG